METKKKMATYKRPEVNKKKFNEAGNGLKQLLLRF